MPLYPPSLCDCFLSAIALLTIYYVRTTAAVTTKSRTTIVPGLSNCCTTEVPLKTLLLGQSLVIHRHGPARYRPNYGSRRRRLISSCQSVASPTGPNDQRPGSYSPRDPPTSCQYEVHGRCLLCQSRTPPCRLRLLPSAHLTVVNRFHDAHRPPAAADCT